MPGANKYRTESISDFLDTLTHMQFFKKANKRTVHVFLAFIGIVLLAYVYQCGFNKVCGSRIVERVVRNEKEIILPRGSVYVEIVETPKSRAQGLSERKRLAEDEGMLFVFEHPGKYGFWMKDMLFSIDMVWIDEAGVVVHIERNVSPETYSKQTPPQTFVNTPDAKYVLELASGGAEKFGLYLGSKVKIGE